MDQFFNPHEFLYTPKEILFWFKENNIEFVNLLPHCNSEDSLIRSTKKVPKLSKLKEISMIFNMRQISEGVFFKSKKKDTINYHIKNLKIVCEFL